jgi:calcium permeable stress-gated cation channel
MAYSRSSIRMREFIVMCCVVLLLFFWVIPITALAGLLSYKEIKKIMPWLGELIDRNDKVRVLVQNSLPPMAMIILNALLPFLLEGRLLRFLPLFSWLRTY